ncbi:hypothetical protein ScPMuIL_003990 [Solemya velum]
MSVTRQHVGKSSDMTVTRQLMDRSSVMKVTRQVEDRSSDMAVKRQLVDRTSDMTITQLKDRYSNMAVTHLLDISSNLTVTRQLMDRSNPMTVTQELIVIFNDDSDAVLESLVVDDVPTVFIAEPEWNISTVYNSLLDSQPEEFTLLYGGCSGDAGSVSIVMDISYSQSCFVSGAASVMGLPVITSSLRHCDGGYPVVRVRPDIQMYVRGVIDMFLHADPSVSKLGLVLGSASNVELAKIQQHYGVGLELVILNTDIYNINFIRNIAEQNIRHIGVLDKLQTLQTLVDDWIFVPLDVFQCPRIRQMGKGVICMHHEVQHIRNKITNFDRRMSFNAIGRQHGFHHTVSSRLVQNHRDTNDVKDRKRLVQSTVTLQCEDSADSLVRLHLIVNSQFFVNLIGWWTLSGGVTVTRHPWQGLSSLTLIVDTMHEPPFIIKSQGPDGVEYRGYTIDVLDQIMSRMELTYTIREPDDGTWGVKKADGTWSGVIGDVSGGIADIGAGPISVTAQREKAIDFTTPYYDLAGIQILTKNPDSSKDLFVFVSVFTHTVWGCWAGVLVSTGVLMFLFDRAYFLRDKSRRDKKFSLKDGMWFVVGSFTMAGVDTIPRTTSTRILIAGFWFFCSIMMGTYTANLAAFLTVSRMSAPIESLDDLTQQSAIKYSVVAGTAGESYFRQMAEIEESFYTLWKEISFSQTSSDSDVTGVAVWDYPLGDRYMQLWKSMQENGMVHTSEEGIHKILNGDFAFLYETPMIAYEMSRRCGLMAVGSQFSSKPYAFVLPQDSPLTKPISTVILALQSETILEKLKEKWWTTDGVTCEDDDEQSGLTLTELGGIFYVMIGGVLLGLIALSIEVLVSFVLKSQRLKSYIPR